MTFNRKSIETIFSDVTQEIIKLVGSQMKSTRARVGRGPKASNTVTDFV